MKWENGKRGNCHRWLELSGDQSEVVLLKGGGRGRSRLLGLRLESVTHQENAF